MNREGGYLTNLNREGGVPNKFLYGGGGYPTNFNRERGGT